MSATGRSQLSWIDRSLSALAELRNKPITLNDVLRFVDLCRKFWNLPVEEQHAICEKFGIPLTENEYQREREIFVALHHRAKTDKVERAILESHERNKNETDG